MASITLSSVRALVRTRGDLPLSRKFTDDYLDVEIQSSWTALHRLVEKVNEGYWDTSSTTPTIANQAYVALPSAAWKVKGVDILDGGSYRELRQVGIADRNRYSTNSTGQPVAFRLTERGIDLFPTPNAVFTIRITYARKVTALGASAVVVDEEWQDFVMWSAILKVAPSEERPMNDYQQMIDRATAAIIDGVSGRKQQEPEYLVLREYNDDSEWCY